MPLIDDLELPLPEPEMNRRKFLGVLGCGALAAATAGTAATGLAYIRPNVLYEADTRFRVGRPDLVPAGGVLALPRQKLYVARQGRGFIAYSAVCTHLGCMTRYEPDRGRIFCPCHGSQYTLDGQVTVGPAPKALPRLKLTLEKGLLVVDTKTPAAPDEVLEV